MKYLYPTFVKPMGVTSATRKLKSQETAVLRPQMGARSWTGAISEA